MDELDLLTSSPFFDVAHYSQQAGLAFADVREGAAHYHATGWNKELNPSSLFDTNFYLRSNPDVRLLGICPLIHFLRHGRQEGRKPRVGAGSLSIRPTAPPPNVWEALRQQISPDREPPIVDIVVPVYRGYDDTLACLYSVLTSSNRTAYELVVINDCSPEPALVAMLDRLAGAGLIHLIHNDRNLGFVQTTNLGMALNTGRDVILLNSDTIVYGNWIDRLRQHVLDTPRLGTVTPWSNNATIMSYPHFCEANNTDLEIDFPELDALAAARSSGCIEDVPTGVGFCFYINRACLDDIGYFDAEAFGRGYGEENDFCLRAQKRGWRNVCATDVFVRHTGEVSFHSDASEGKRAGLQALLGKHPEYLSVVRSFIKTDPLHRMRGVLDVARLARWGDGRVLLYLEHSWGGGIGRHIEDLTSFAQSEGFKVVRAFPSGKVEGMLELSPVGAVDFPNLPLVPIQDPVTAASILGSLGICHVHIHSLVGYKLHWFDFILATINRLKLPFDFTLHDYAPICPRLNMVDWGQVYCDRPSKEYCQICVDKDGSPFGVIDVDTWTSAYNKVLAQARRLFAPNQDVIDRFATFMPEVLPKLRLRPHPEKFEGLRPSIDHAGRPSERVIGVIGAIGANKGSKVLFAMMAEAFRAKLPVRFVLYGYSDLPHLSKLPNVTVTGAYRDDEIDALLQNIPCDVAFFPSVCPETYGYTLTVALRNRIYPVCFDIGAPAARLRQLRYGKILPLELAFNPLTLIKRIIELPLFDPPGDLGETLREQTQWHSVGSYYEDRALASLALAS